LLIDRTQPPHQNYDAHDRNHGAPMRDVRRNSQA
jgi:hypothetical protein